MDNFIKQLNPVYFWDGYVDKMNPELSKRLIIERFFTLGNIKEIKLILSFYQKEEVIKTLCSLNYLDPKTLNFVSIIFNIPKSRFRCYRRKQLKAQHWN